MGNQIENGAVLSLSWVLFCMYRPSRLLWRCGGRETFCLYSRNHNHAHSFMRERRVIG